jgi:hypothetical protein
MSFLKKREPDNRGINRLPKQPSPPTLKQLQGMFQDTIQNARASQIEFGDPPEEYSLAVFKDRQKNEVHWALYHGEGEASMMVWDQPSNDPGYIHQLITAQFPGFDLKPVALRPSEEFRTDIDMRRPPTSTSQMPQPLQGTYEPQISGHTGAKATLEGDLKNIQMPNVL